MNEEKGLDIEAVTAEARAYVAGLSDAEVLRRLTDRRDKEAEKKAAAARKKALAKAIETEVDARGKDIEIRGLHESDCF